MKTSAESMSWYNKVNETWKSIGVNPDVRKSTPADYKIACKTIKALWKKEMGTKFPYDLKEVTGNRDCLLYTSPSPRDGLLSRMPSSA